MEYQSEVPETIQIALMTSIEPNELQVYILQHVEEKTSYATIRDRVMGIARNRISMSSPMEVSPTIARVAVSPKKIEPVTAEGHVFNFDAFNYRYEKSGLLSTTWRSLLCDMPCPCAISCTTEVNSI